MGFMVGLKLVRLTMGFMVGLKLVRLTMGFGDFMLIKVLVPVRSIIWVVTNSIKTLKSCYHF